MMYIDTHGHVNFNAFKHDSDAVLNHALESNTWVIMPGTQFSTSKRAVEMASSHGKGVYAAVGLHPIHLEEREVDVLEVQSERVQKESWMTFETKGEEFDYVSYHELIANAPAGKVVAIGEVGLDYYYEPKGKEKRQAFRMKQNATLALQIKLAQEFHLPVILHCRKAHDELLEFLRGRVIRGVVHCYTGTLAQAKKFYDMGLYFGFNGLIFKRVSALPDPQEIIKNIPLERILLETDAPYLVPLQAGQERNEPVFVKYIAEEIARIKRVSLKEVADATAKNAKAVFGLPG